MATGYTGVGHGITSTVTLWNWFGELLYTNVLEEFYPRLLLHDYGEHITFPANQGQRIHRPVWTKTKPVSELTFSDDDQKTVDSSSRDETYSPVSHDMTLTSYEGMLQIFGGSFKFTDTFMAVNQIVEVLTAGARMLGGDYAENVEDNALKILLALAAGAGEEPIYLGSGGKAWGSVVDTTDYFSMTDIFRVTTEFQSNVDGATYTYPDGTYKGIVHPRVKHDLFTNETSTGPNLISWLTTTRGQGYFEGQSKIPVIDGVSLDFSAHNTTDPFAAHGAFTQATFPTAMGGTTPGVNGSGFVTGDKGYMSLFFAPGAYANVDLASASPSLILQPFGSAGTEDSLKRKMTVGVKGVQTCIPQQVSRRMILMATAASTTP